MPEGKHVILCVDDDADILMALRVVLEKSGYAVLTATSGQEGAALFERHRPDLLIVDLMMEEVDAGLTFARLLQARGNTAPVFCLSSAGEYLHGNMDPGDLRVTGVFQKPIDPGTLLAVVGQALASRPARTEDAVP